MVTLVGSTIPGPPRANDVEQSRTSRSVNEVRRTVAQRDVSGADATRLLNLARQAEQSADRGKAPEASRIAREALQQARDLTGNGLPQRAEANTPTPEAATPLDEGSREGTPAAQSVSGDPQSPQARNTRTYQDGSDDQGISFQYPQPLSNAQAPLAVRQHELSHIRRETSDAIIEGRRVQASVTIKRSIDPETGEVIVEGGRARILDFPEVQLPVEVSITVEEEDDGDPIELLGEDAETRNDPPRLGEPDEPRPGEPQNEPAQPLGRQIDLLA